ncbi:MAG: hypothetical protein ACAH88_06310 [Roseimicrobium sp.]
MSAWTGYINKPSDKARVLSDGRIVVNPRLWVNPDGYKAAVESMKSTPEAKRQALEILPQLQKRAATDLINSLQTIRDVPEVKEWFDAHPGTVEEQAAALVKEQKGAVFAQAMNRVNSGGAGIANQGIGVLAALTGFVKDKTGLSLGDDYLHQSMQYWHERSGAWERLAALGDTGVIADSATKVLGGATSMLPPLAGGKVATSLAGRFLGAGKGLQAVGMGSTSLIAAGQSGGGTYSDAYAAHVQRGLPEAEARKQALKPALVSGIITGLTTGFGGAKGVESIFRSNAGRELVKKTLLERAKAVGINMGEEALEEGTDTLLQGINARLTYNPDKPLEEIVGEAFEAAWIGGVLGGSVSGVRQGAEMRDTAKQERLEQEVSEINGAEMNEQGADAEARLDFSRGKELREGRLAKQMQDIATPGAFRRGPASQAKDLGDIVRESSIVPGEAKLLDYGYPFYEGDTTYRFEHQEGGVAFIHVGNGKVWLTSNDMRSDPQKEKERERMKGAEGEQKQGVKKADESDYIQGGDLLYQSAMTYAHNNGLKFTPDNVVSDIAKLRRNSHMLSSALRHGTTKHLWPFGAETSANDSVASGWKEGDSKEAFEHNLELLANQELQNVEKVLDKKGQRITDLHYDEASDTIEKQTKNPDGTLSGWQRLSEGDLESLVDGLDPGNSGVGPTTLSRALLIQSALEGHELVRNSAEHYRSEETLRGGVVPAGRREKLRRVLGSREAPRKIFYSRGESSDSGRIQRTGVTQAETAAAETRLKSSAEGRAIYGNVLIVDSREALDGLKGRPDRQGYHAEDWNLMQDAEGFHDPRNGTVVLFRNNIRVLEGETAAQAMARVVVHERVGHHGFDALRKNDSKFSGAWSSLAQAIPQKEMQELETRYKYLEGNRDVLALEWFAHRVGDMEGRAQLEPGSLTQRMWQALRDFVERIYSPLGDPSKPMSPQALDAHVRSLIKATRRNMVKTGRRNPHNRE